jgi:hypothetical protein
MAPTLRRRDWRTTPAQELTTRRSNAHGLRCQRGCRPGMDASRAGGGGHLLRRSLRSLRSVIRRQDPPAAGCGNAVLAGHERERHDL